MQTESVQDSATHVGGLTVYQIRDAVSRLKPVSLRTVYNNIDALRIKPIGVRQHPQLYPPDTAEKILQRYGLSRR